jgi:ribosomal protein L2
MYGVRHTPLSRIKESEKMSIKVYKPTINSRRNMSVTDYSELSKVAPERSLLEPLSKNAGRNYVSALPQRAIPP